MQVLFHLTGIAIMLLLGLGCNFYVTHRLISPRYGQRGTRIYMLLHAIILLALTTIGAIATFGGLQESIPILVWVMYAFMLLYLPKVCYSMVSWIDYLKHPRGSWGGYIGYFLAVLCIVLIVGSTFNRYRIDVKEATVTSTHLPMSFDGYRIVQISDLHLETLYSRPFAQRIVDCINALQPDLILYTGDIVNRRAVELLPYQEILSQLQARDGIFSVMGNHDYGDFVKWENKAAREANLAQLRQIKADMGWQLLDNTTQFIYRNNDSIAIIGVENWGEPPFSQYGDLPVAYPALHDDNFKILLSHNPHHWRAEVIPTSNIDLTLSGHTHALQMQIGNFSPVAMRYPEWGGLYREGEQYLYVNIGIGCTMFPTRLGATPEVTLLTLQSKP